MFVRIYKKGKTLNLTRSVARSVGTIKVSAKTSLVTDHVRVRGDGYKPLQAITVRATARCEPERLSFASSAHILTNNNGDFDLSTSESIGGTYNGVDSTGLFWSMISESGYINRFQMNNASTPIQYDFSTLEGHVIDHRDDAEKGVLCRTSIVRTFLRENIARKVIRNPPLHGALFLPPGAGPFPAIITLYGGMKRRQVVEDAAAILANSGYVTFAMAFSGHEGLPKDYTDEPVRIELFDKAVRFLQSLDVVDSNAVGVYGISKGGELAFAMACFLPDIKAAVNVNSAMYAIGSDITYGDAVIPNGGVDPTKLTQLNDGTWILKDAVYKCAERPASILPIENTNAELLYVVGSDDKACPSEEHADFAAEKMSSSGKTNLEVLKLPGVGHLVDAPLVPPCFVSKHLFLPQGLTYYGGGGDKRLHSKQVEYAWVAVLNFFKRTLG